MNVRLIMRILHFDCIDDIRTLSSHLFQVKLLITTSNIQEKNSILTISHSLQISIKGKCHQFTNAGKKKNHPSSKKSRQYNMSNIKIRSPYLNHQKSFFFIKKKVPLICRRFKKMHSVNHMQITGVLKIWKGKTCTAITDANSARVSSDRVGPSTDGGTLFATCVYPRERSVTCPADISLVDSTPLYIRMYTSREIKKFICYFRQTTRVIGALNIIGA